MAQMIRRARRWWTARRSQGEECEVCGRRDRRNVTVSSTPRVHAALAGWSSISATWCREHCPEEHRP